MATVASTHIAAIAISRDWRGPAFAFWQAVLASIETALTFLILLGAILRPLITERL